MKNNGIRVDDKAPLFKLESINAGTIDLAELIGKKYLVLIFSRYFGCPVCQLDFNELIKRSSEIKKLNAEILYITQSGEDVANEFIRTENIDFPVILSSKDGLFKDYGLGVMPSEVIEEMKLRMKMASKEDIKHGVYEGWEQQCPGQFVLNKEGYIVQVKKGWLDINAIINALDSSFIYYSDEKEIIEEKPPHDKILSYKIV